MTAIYARLTGDGPARVPGGVRLMAAVAVADGRVFGLTLPLPAGWAVLPSGGSRHGRASRDGRTASDTLQHWLRSPGGKIVALTVWADRTPGEDGPGAASSDCQSWAGGRLGPPRRTLLRGAVALEDRDGYFSLTAGRESGRLDLEWRAAAPVGPLRLAFTGTAPDVLEPLIPCLPYLRGLRTQPTP